MSQKQERKRLGDLLLESGLITAEQLEETLREKAPGQKLGDALVERGYITEQKLIEVLEFQLGIPHVSLYRYPIDIKLTKLIPQEFAKRKMVMPLKQEGERLLVAMADPMDFFTIDDLRLSTGFHIETAIASKDDILRTINKYYGLDVSIDEYFDVPQPRPAEEAKTVEEDSPIIRLVNQIIQAAVEQKASDIHIDPQETKILVRYRVDGILRTEKALPKSIQSALTSRIKILANLDITEYRIPQDGRFKVHLQFHPIDLRVSTLPTIFGEKIVMRILDLGSVLNDLSKLGFHKLNYERFLELIERPNGMVLVTGPTGSGKSSTLYAALNHLNREEVNIITVEDPVEYQVEGINQIQVNPNIGLTFAKGLRSILRQDPNIIMIGEIRDIETAEVAIRAALTGHLVLSTLHTNDSISTITRLIDMGIEPFLVASALNGVISQRLVRRVCLDCRQEQPAMKWEVDIFAKRGLQIDKVVRGKGCPTCNMTGYKGRVAIQELMMLTDEMRYVIYNREPLSKLKELAIRNRMLFLIDDGLLKVKQGLTTPEEILRVVTLS